MNYNVNLSAESLRTIIIGLQELPYKLSAPVIDDLTKQITNQPKEESKPNSSSKVKTDTKDKS